MSLAEFRLGLSLDEAVEEDPRSSKSTSQEAGLEDVEESYLAPPTLTKLTTEL